MRLTKGQLKSKPTWVDVNAAVPKLCQNPQNRNQEIHGRYTFICSLHFPTRPSGATRAL
jgi:hypothetical protein